MIFYGASTIYVVESNHLDDWGNTSSSSPVSLIEPRVGTNLFDSHGVQVGPPPLKVCLCVYMRGEKLADALFEP